MHWNYCILYTWLYITDSNSFNFDGILGNFGLHWWIPEGRNMSTIKMKKHYIKTWKISQYYNLCRPSWPVVTSHLSSTMAGQIYFVLPNYIKGTEKRSFFSLTPWEKKRSLNLTRLRQNVKNRASLLYNIPKGLRTRRNLSPGYLGLEPKIVENCPNKG